MSKQVAKSRNTRYVYCFGCAAELRGIPGPRILGKKGANLVEISELKIPVPPGFVISSEIRKEFESGTGIWKNSVRDEIHRAVELLEKEVGLLLGDPQRPLLLSVRSSPQFSMPGILDTFLNVGLVSDIQTEFLAGISKEFATSLNRSVLDNYNRIIEMQRFNPVPANADLCRRDFLGNANSQLFAAIEAVFASWNNRRAVRYRNIVKKTVTNDLAVVVQAMVFGNLGQGSGTGVAYTRDPRTGERGLCGEWLPSSQGEDLVSGIQTPYLIEHKIGNTEQSLTDIMPANVNALRQIANIIEGRCKDMQEIEFTIQEKRLWILQARTGSRSLRASRRIAYDMVNEGLIARDTAMQRINEDNADYKTLIEHKIVKNGACLLAIGRPASPGGASGRIVLDPERAEKMASSGEKVILIRETTTPEDVHGINAAEGMVTCRGGMASHAAVVARGWNIPCIVACQGLRINLSKEAIEVSGKELLEGDWLSIDGSEGCVYSGKLALTPVSSAEYCAFTATSEGTT